MAYTKILVIHNRLDKCVDYTQDEEKTSLEAAIDYALNREKTERTCFETAINCDRERVYGVKVRSNYDDAVAPDLTERSERAFDLLDKLARNTVTPTGLPDVLADWRG